VLIHKEKNREGKDLGWNTGAERRQRREKGHYKKRGSNNSNIREDNQKTTKRRNMKTKNKIKQNKAKKR
jgi:hypothetical protein